MKRTFLAILLALAVFGGLIFLISMASKPANQVKQDAVVLDETSPTMYSNQELGLSFEYKAGSTGYVVEEIVSTDPSSGLLRTITLHSQSDSAVPVGGEGAPVISIGVFDNAQKQSPRMWADAHMQYSNINLIQGGAKEDVVGGANAIRYIADGLYASDTVVVAHGEFVHVISGQFMDQNSAIAQDFGPLVESIQFIPTATATVQGKLDINAVCEGALIYMTFTDSESADTFVAECKEGKHPEVIEQYKAQMGLGDGAQI